MVRTACTEPQCLYKGALYLTLPVSCSVQWVSEIKHLNRENDMTSPLCSLFFFFRMWEEHYIIDATLVASDWLDSCLTTHLFDPVKLQSELVLLLLHSFASTVWKSCAGRLNLCFEPDLKLLKKI